MDSHLSLEGHFVPAQRLRRTWGQRLGIGVAASSSSWLSATPAPVPFTSGAAASLLLVRLAIVEARNVDYTGVTPLGFARVLVDLVGLEIHLGVEDDEFLFLALAVRAEIVVVTEVLLERIVVSVVMRRPRVLPIAQEASLVPFAAVLVEFVTVVKA